MELYTRVAGDGPPLVLLHGLFGSNENLGGVARALSDRFTIYGMDLRNHGRSPHADSMEYASLALDVRETLDAHHVEKATILGHSLGGKTAMELALSSAERVSRLVVVDIAPVAYDRRHDQELEALHSLDLTAIGSRSDADTALADRIPNPAIRQFLLKNLNRMDTGFAWRIPLETIYREYDRIAAPPPSTGPYHGPTLFIRGGNSDYLPQDAESAIHARFPNADMVTLANVGHWAHAESPEEFLNAVTRFLESQPIGRKPRPTR